MKPKYSIIIPVYNDQEGLKVTLNSLCKLEFQKNKYEIIVVDNKSTDKTLNILKQFRKEYPNLLKIFQEKSIQSSYAARNKGIKNARGEYILFIDSNMWVEKDWLKEIDNSLKNIEYAGQNVQLVAKKDNIFSTYNKLTGFPIENYIEKNRFAPTCCLITKKTLFEKIGYFNHKLISGGDFEFGQRVYKRRIEQHYLKNITLYHPARSSLSQLKKKYIRIGKGMGQTSKYYHHIKWFTQPLLKYLLPENPFKFRSRYRSNPIWEKLNLIQKFLLYTIKWISKLYTIKGYTKYINQPHINN